MILLKKYIQDLLEDNSVFVSIGANDGVFVDEIFQSNLLNMNWTIYLIEPVYQTYQKLISNYNRYYPNNKFNFINIAINTYDGDGFLITNNNDDSFGLCSFFRAETTQSVKIPVICSTFKSFINKYQISNIDFLKIDTEGMDYEIVKQSLLSKIYPKIILLENIGISNSSVTTFEDMIKQTQDNYVLIHDTPEFQYENDNLLLIRKEYV